MSAPTSGPGTGIGAQVWRFLGSLRLAVVLLVVLAAACFVGIVLSQPESFRSDRYLSRRLNPESPEALKLEEFVALARAAGVAVRGETYEAFLARARGQGLSEEECPPRFLAAFVESVRRDEDSEACLRLFYADDLGVTLGRLFIALQFHRVFSSAWFRGLCLLLVVNVVACSVQRLGGQWRVAFGLRASDEPAWYARRSAHALVARAGDPMVSAGAVERALRERGFRAVRRPSAGGVTLEAARGWIGGLGRLWPPLGRLAGLGRLGSQVVHLGVVLIVIGGFISGRLGFRHAQVLAPGDVAAVPEAPARLADSDREARGDWREGIGEPSRQVVFRLELKSFEVRFDSRGREEYYGAHVALLDTDPPAEQVIAVNHPLIYRGYYAYQHSYQPDYRRISSVSFVVEELREGGAEGGGFHQESSEGEVVRRLSVVAQPGADLVVPGTALKLRILRYFPHWQIPLERGEDGRIVAGPARNLSDEPANPAIQVHLEAPGREPRDRWVPLPLPLQAGGPRGDISYGTFRLVPVEFRPGYNTVLVFKTHPIMLPVWIGCAVVMLGVVLCFYCNHERVWVLVRPREGGSEIHLAGDAFKWRERFRERFDSIVQAITEPG